MFSALKVALALSSLAGSVLAQSTCTIPALTCSSPGPQTTYLAEPCYPTTGFCYSANYYAVGVAVSYSTSGGDFTSQLRKECEATCDSQTQCLSYTGELVVGLNQQLAVGTCFFYSVQQISPRQCVDAPSTVIAYYKQKVCAATTTTTTTTKSSTTTTSSTTTKSSTTTTSSTTKPVTTTSSSTTTSSTTKPVTTTSSSTTTSTTTKSTTSPTTTSTTASTTASTTTTSTTASTTTSTTTSTTASTTSTTASTTTSSTTTSTTASTTSSTTATTTSSTTSSTTTSTTASTTSSTTSSTTTSTTASTTSSTTTTASTTSSTTSSSTTTTPAASPTNCVDAQAYNPYTPSSNNCGCTYTVTCGSYNDPANRYQFTATSVADCASQCDSYDDCYQLEYDFAGNCYLYADAESALTGTNAISGRMNCADSDCTASEEQTWVA